MPKEFTKGMKYGLGGAVGIGALAVIIIVGLTLAGIPIPNPFAQPAPGTPGGQVITTPTPGVVYGSAKLYWSMKDAVTGAAVTDGTEGDDFSIVGSDNIFDTMSLYETVTSGITGATTSNYYAEKDFVVAKFSEDGDPTGGTDYYDTWVYFRLYPGNEVRTLTYEALSVLTSTPTYTYKITEGTGALLGTIGWDTGATKYWVLPNILMMPRIDMASLDTQISYSGTILSQVTDGSSWDDTQSEQNADATLTSTTSTLYIRLDGDTASLAYGAHQLSVGSVGKIEKRVAVITIATNMTSMQISSAGGYTWTRVNDSKLSNDIAFYTVLNPADLTPIKANLIALSIPLTIDSSGAASATAYSIKFNIIDLQIESSVASGTVTAAPPSVFGMVSDYGPSDTIPTATDFYTVGSFTNGGITESGAVNQPQLFADITTA